MPLGETKFYKSPFLRDFWHLNVAMMTSNNALIPDPDKEDILASSPTDWPWLHLGLRMCGWGDNQIKYYLVGEWLFRFTYIFYSHLDQEIQSSGGPLRLAWASVLSFSSYTS